MLSQRDAEKLANAHVTSRTIAIPYYQHKSPPSLAQGGIHPRGGLKLSFLTKLIAGAGSDLYHPLVLLPWAQTAREISHNAPSLLSSCHSPSVCLHIPLMHVTISASSLSRSFVHSRLSPPVALCWCFCLLSCRFWICDCKPPTATIIIIIIISIIMISLCGTLITLHSLSFSPPMFDEKKTSRNIYFVSIHNSLYTQCIGAPIKKHLFFQTFFSTFFKKPQIFFSTESKESSVHEQATTEFLIMSCKVNNFAAQIHIISEAKQNKKRKT